jgi:hypothetical protein
MVSLACSPRKACILLHSKNGTAISRSSNKTDGLKIAPKTGPSKSLPILRGDSRYCCCYLLRLCNIFIAWIVDSGAAPKHTIETWNACGGINRYRKGL